MFEFLSKVRPSIWAVLGGTLVILGISRRKPSGRFMLPSFVNPKRKITNTTVASDGVVYASPKDLARQANTDVETYTLARVMGSETNGPVIEKAAIGWVIRNEARLRGWSLLRLATTKSKIDIGYYGKQAGRFMSTAQDPSEADLFIATMILTNTWPDHTMGAQRFFDPSDQDALFQRGAVEYDAQGLMAKRNAEGFVVVPVTGVDPRNLVLFRKIG